MNSLINFMTMIGVEKTLIIACGRLPMRDYIDISDDVSFFFLPDHMLLRYDACEKEQLQTAIDKCGCTQVVFLGMLDDEMKCRLTFQSTLHTLRAGLHFNTALLPKDGTVITTRLRIQALLEQHVATQCSYLMEYHFVGKKVRNGQLTVRGIVGTPEAENYSTVFCNGVRFNDFVSMN
ncbi:MAG TPA: hypothetical protein VK658_28485 [Chryseolinea sp.]|nr:hypothetical protein [Chryseolinea sp.]